MLIDGRDATDCAQDWLREQIAVVLQDTVLFTGSVRDNIAYGTDATDARDRRRRQGRRRPRLHRAPARTATTPSSGPRERGSPAASASASGIARTLLRNPPIIILDEPTTALDQDSEGQVMDGLDRLMRGRTCILITHSARLASTADQIVELDHGRITEASLG